LEGYAFFVNLSHYIRAKAIMWLVVAGSAISWETLSLSHQLMSDCPELYYGVVFYVAVPFGAQVP